jgi:hypothetical protein
MYPPSQLRRFLLVSAAGGAGLLFWWVRGNRPIAPEANPVHPAQAPAGADAVAAGQQAAAATAKREDSASRDRGDIAGSLKQRLQAVLALPQTADRRQALEDLAGALARKYPERAREVLRSIQADSGEAGADAYAFVSGFSSDYAALNPAAAAAWVESLPLALKFNACSFVAAEWGKTDLKAATTWAEGIEDLSLRTAVLRRIAQELEGGANLTAVAAWAQRLAASPEASHNAELIGRLWAKADVQGAFQWSSNLADPAQRNVAVLAVTGAVAGEDPQVVSAWVEKFPDGELRSQAVAVTSAKWSESDPESAARWVARLGDPQLLEMAMPAIAGRWLRKDRVAATEWIRGSQLSKQAKDYLLPGG